MIPKAHITAWRQYAPWQNNSQVEQDLIISRGLVALFNNELLSQHLAFRGGTALHKLFLPPPVRYSEDIDLVQLKSGPIKPIMQEIREEFRFISYDRTTDSSDHNWIAVYRFNTEFSPPPQMKVKIEINTREHFNVLPLRSQDISVDNPWFTGSAGIVTYEQEEILGTKLRALYQRSKGRDLFDLDYALKHLEPDISDIIRCFYRYLEKSDVSPPTAKEFELNMQDKMKNPEFLGDTEGLLRPEVEYDPQEAHDHILDVLIQRI